MFRQFFARPSQPTRRDGRPIYAIGDVHGRSDLLEPLLQKIFADAGGRDCVLVLLGDYVDRGSASREVIERLSSGGFPPTMQTVFLKGNHEAAMLDFLDQPEAGRAWVEHGGYETFMSYGVRPPAIDADIGEWREASNALRAAIPQSHLDWLKALELSFVHDRFFFAHAGVDKSFGPDDQDAATLLWARRSFLEDKRRWPLTVVHGHTPQTRPVVAQGRIGVDTGAYATGRLTAVRLENRAIDFFFARSGNRTEER